jgi:hypothetical protein
MFFKSLIYEVCLFKKIPIIKSKLTFHTFSFRQFYKFYSKIELRGKVLRLILSVKAFFTFFKGLIDFRLSLH